MTTIFAPITSYGNSGIAVIRISGNLTLECLKYLGISKKLLPRTAHLCKIIHPHNNQIIDQALVIFFPNPNSFTGEDVAEISLHSSPYIIETIIKLLGEIAGVRLAEAGEFSKTAFLNGKMDLVEAEAIVDLIEAETEQQHRQAINQMQGHLSKIYESWRTELISIIANLEAYIDFPDQDLPEDIIDDLESRIANLAGAIRDHLHDNNRGEKIRTGLSMAIIGAPNVGKSSLINYLAKSDVAIVSEIAGTTRDIIQTHLSIAGIPVIISDTAGLRETDDEIEKEGIRRSIIKANSADIKILVLDIYNLNNFNLNIADLIDDHTLILINKIDIKNISIPDNISKYAPILISIKEKINLEEFLNSLEKQVRKIASPGSMPLITRSRYREALNEALKNLSEFSMQKDIELSAEDLRLAIRSIGKITGKVSANDILDVIFSGFCIGK